MPASVARPTLWHRWLTPGLLALTVTLANGQTPEAKRLFAEAVVLERNPSPQNFTDAAARLTRAIALSPDYLSAHIELAICQRALGQFAEAIDSCGKALRLKPDSAKALAVQAHCQVLLADQRPAEGATRFAEAERIYREMVRIDKKDYGAHYRLAQLLRSRLNRTEEAIAACREALRIQPSFADAHFELGECLSPPPGRDPDAKAFAESIKAYREAVRHKRDFVAAYLALADRLQRAGRADEAIATCTEGIKACRNVTTGLPHVGHLYHLLGMLQLAAGDHAAAMKVSAELRPLDPTNAALLAAAITRSVAARNPEGGVVVLNTSPDGQPSHRRVTTAEDARNALQPGQNTVVLLGDPAVDAYNRGIGRQAAGDVAGEMAAYQEAIRLKPEFAEAHLNLGHVYLRSGQAEQALACYRESVRVQPGFALGHFAIGVWASERQRWPEAIEAYREAVRLEPKRADMKFNLGRSYLLTKRLGEAIETLQDCVRLDPRDVKSWFTLGMTYLFAERRADAVEVQAKLQPLDAGMAASLQSLLDGTARLPELK